MTAKQPLTEEPARTRRVTMRDVAAAAGVSVQTVSNVVNDRSEHTAPATADRVRRIIEQLGFRPNATARGLRVARTQVLAFLVMDPAARFLGDPMTDLFLAGMGDELRDRSYELLIRACEPGARLESVLEPLIDGRVDGAVVSLSGDRALRQRYLAELRAVKAPTILLQEHGTGDDDVPAIAASDREGSREICRHLIEVGHRRIAFLTAAHVWSAIDERIAGYHEAHAEADLRPEQGYVHRAGEFKPLPASIAAGDLLDRYPRPTAVMCANDLIALGVMKAARDRGLKVPDDLAVAGFDDFEFAAAMDPPLTTVRIPGYEMGAYAAGELIDALASHRPPRGRAYATELFVRASA